jgi:hypothetical protein
MANMAVEAIVEQSTPDVQPLTRPYPPSWVDHLIALIERLPGPVWLFYGLLLLALILVTNALQWWDGTLPFGTFHWVRITEPFYLVYSLALIHYLNSVARRALEGFRPAMAIDESAYAGLHYELMTMPAHGGLVTLGIGAMLGILIVWATPADFGVFARSSRVTLIFEGVVIASFGAAAVVTLLYHTLRQLHLVSQIHRRATHINLFKPAPVYAFSVLTARTGIGLYFFSLFIIAADPVMASHPVAIAVTVALILLGTAAFVLPLNSMHRRLVEEKERLIAEANRRIVALMTKLHHQVDIDSLERSGELNSAMNALMTERDLLDKLSTWPWKPATLRGFVSSVMLPIVLWLITRYLGQFI